LANFKAQVTAFVEYLKDTPPAEGFTEVLYPGELEYRTEQRRRAEGIPVEEDTWERVAAIARRCWGRLSRSAASAVGTPC